MYNQKKIDTKADEFEDSINFFIPLLEDEGNLRFEISKSLTDEHLNNIMEAVNLTLPPQIEKCNLIDKIGALIILFQFDREADSIAEAMEKYLDLTECLLVIVKSSSATLKNITNIETVAARAITILNIAKTLFSRMDLSAIQVSGANLSYGIFDETKFKNANLQGVNLEGAWLRGANLQGAFLTDTNFGELPCLNLNYLVRDCCYSPDGNWLAIAVKNLIYIYNVSTQHLEKIKNDTDVSAIIFHANSQCLTAVCNKNVKIWDIINKTSKTFNMEVWFRALHPKGQQLIYGLQESDLKLWDIEGEFNIKIFGSQLAQINCLVFDSNGEKLASGESGGIIRIWDIKDGICIKTLEKYSNSKDVYKLAFHPDGDQLALGSKDNVLRLWNLESNATMIFEGHVSYIQCIAFSPNGQQLAVGNIDNTIMIWNVINGKLSNVLTGHIDWVMCIAFNPIGNQLVSGGGNKDATLKFWNISSDLLKPMENHKGNVTSLALHPRGHQLATGSKDKSLKLWDARTGACIRTFRGHTHAVNSVVFHPNGRQIVSGSADHTIRYWNIETGDIKLIGKHENNVSIVVFHPNGHLLISGTNGDKEDPEYIGTVFTEKNNCLILSTSDIRYALKVWNVEKCTFIKMLQGHAGSITSLIFHPTTCTLISSSADETIRVWNIESGESLKLLEIPLSRDYVKSMSLHPIKNILYYSNVSITTCFSFHPDGNFVASAKDNLLKIEQYFNGNGYCEITTSSIINCLCWNKLEQNVFLITGHHDTSVCYWRFVDAKDAVHLQLIWSSHIGGLVVSNANFKDANGLSFNNSQLLEQKGALVNSPLKFEQKSQKNVIQERKEPKNVVYFKSLFFSDIVSAYVKKEEPEKLNSISLDNIISELNEQKHDAEIDRGQRFRGNY